MSHKTALSFASIVDKRCVPFSSKSGSQYCAFCPSSKYLAATSDLAFGAIVWDMATKDMVLHVRTPQPALAVSFAPNREGLLIFAESHTRVHVLDVRWVIAVCISGQTPSRDGFFGGGVGLLCDILL